MPMAIVEKVRPHVSVIRLNDPDTLNSLSFELVGDLYEAIREVAADNDCWVAILTGAGRGFCSGLNLDYVGVPPGSEGLPLSRLAIRAMQYMSHLIPAMRDMPQPLIAAVNGPAYGGGMCVPMGADIRIAGESAAFRCAGINNGLTGCELGLSYLLPRLIGASHANEIILTGRLVDARDAERVGIVSRVVPDDQLLDCAIELAEQMGAYSTHGISMTKKILWDSLETGSLQAAINHEDRNQLLVRLTTKNLEEAIHARNQKRPPVYED
jgi:enoyl-CoA hydratase